MKRYTFSEDLISKYPLLKRTQLLLSEVVDLNSVEDVISDLLPEPSEMDPQVSFLCLTVTLTHSIAYWDLIFEYPNGYYPYPIMEYVQNQTIQLEDSFDHSPYLPPSLREKDQTIFKISFKVG